MTGGTIFTAAVTDCEEEPVLLGQILQHDVDEKYYIDDTKLSSVDIPYSDSNSENASVNPEPVK